MASSTPKKRLKSARINSNPTSSPSLGLLNEPSPGFFPSKGEIIRLFGVLAIAVTVGMACNYITTILNRQPKPFCDSDGSPEDFISDFCEPCPKNGECFNGNLECVRGYRKHGRSCVEDGEINQTAKELSKWVELRVCEAYVRSTCDKIGTVWVQESEILKELDKQELKEKFGLKSDSYMFTKQKAMETVESSLETRKGVHGIKELKCPDWLGERYKPLPCYIRQWVLKHAFFVVPVCSLLVGLVTLVTLLLRRVHRSRYLSSRSEELYQQICDILEEKAVMAKSFNGEGEPWVVNSWLRDHLLLPRERKDPLLWKKVEELVQEDTRLDQKRNVVRGEMKVVWEWQGVPMCYINELEDRGRAGEFLQNVFSQDRRKTFPNMQCCIDMDRGVEFDIAMEFQICQAPEK
ncbi:Inner nuclear membrane protein MAN1 [Macleaya cordata]|uniref:Inner nuclear membrane protein MAN1 n=1 Tax=Macleaya cordata TaxID=56857 RepID=A0A200QWI8_MACCD|nr:Inner nuclear membrane protein MAN1 [Macleaya cordata]